MCELAPRADIQKAVVRGKRNTFYRELHKIADKALPKVQRAYMNAIRTMRADIPTRKLIRAIEVEDIEAVEQLIGVNKLTVKFDDVLDELLQIYMKGAKATKEATPSKFVIRKKKGDGIETSFDITNPKSIDALRRDRLDLISNISNKTREGIRSIVIGGFEKGKAPARQARDIKQGIGLLPRQQTALDNFEQLLIDEGVKPAIIKTRTAAYADRLLRQRAKTIARTETIRAANKGQYAMWQQAIDDGLLEPSVRVEWVTTPDDRLCPICESLSGETAEFNSEFGTTIDRPKAGSKAFQSMTPPIHPNCRCALALTFD